ncbi:S8 family serine peptidase [uncultured Roseibium sp.]|uniref:S8 family serine peptidase n=1 Tax=uncultured Roseibium sp. TaxID=1936171 RepID=UPI0026368EC8|nr:S8 family serine peptidase [uncultured Roseibium sp.]
MNDTSTSGSDGNTVSALESYFGPYEAWNFGIGRPYAFPVFRKNDSQFLTALAEHPSPRKPELPASAASKAGRRVWLPTVWGRSENIPLRFWPLVVENKGDGEIGFQNLKGDLQQAVQSPGIDAPRYRMAFPVAPANMHDDAGADLADPDWSPDPKVKENSQGKVINVLAVIDDGIPFAHRNFRAADGLRTRLEFCWVQSADKDPEAEIPSVLFGREYTRDVIEGFIRDHEDEDALYAATGASSEQFGSPAAINRLATHGAHVMDVAAGHDPSKFTTSPEETRLIAVQLPNTLSWDTSSFGKDMYMLSAVHYILERAERIAAGYGVADIRVTINFSYGFSAGGHDGASELEAAINEIVGKRRALGRPTAVVIPSGNTHLQRLHGEITAEDLKSGAFEFTWTVQPSDRTSNYLEIWFPAGFDPGQFTVELKGPFNKAQAALKLRPNADFEDGDPRNFEVVRLGNRHPAPHVGQMSVDNHRSSGRWRVLIALAPSEPDDMDLPAAPAGDWQVKLRRGKGAPADHPPINLWVQRDLDLEAFQKGSRQSYLNDPDYRSYNDRGEQSQTDETDGHVRRFGSLNGMATGETTLIVSGCMPSAANAWDPEQPIPSHYSSAGKVSPDNPVGTVDCTAQSDRSSVLPGMIGAGTRSGSYAVVQGTSVAAPLVARRLSEAFAISSQEEVAKAEEDNYLPLLKKVDLPGGDKEIYARLGGSLII